MQAGLCKTRNALCSVQNLLFFIRENPIPDFNRLEDRALLAEKISHVMAATTAINKCRVVWNKKITAARARAEAGATRATAAKATAEDAAKQECIDDLELDEIVVVPNAVLPPSPPPTPINV
ncbi:unnamed protein product [Arabidopsis lyrata]|nr:unnamed protein product [Arabidopsis lyrata]